MALSKEQILVALHAFMTAKTATPKSAGRILHESEMIAAYPKLESDRARLIEALNLVPALRPLMLKEFGYVPESVLSITNQVRTLLRELEGK